MNRQQRRKMVKNGVTPEDLKKLYNTTKDATKKATIHASSEAFAVITAMVLHDKFGFGEKRLRRAIGYLVEGFDAITEDYATLEDMKKVLDEECNIQFR